MLGETIESMDDQGLVTSFAYDTQGNQIRMERRAAANRALISTSMSFDASGRKISDTDPDSGTSTTRYNALGEVIRVTDAKGQVTENHYDALGRVWQRTATGNANGSELIFKSGFESGEAPAPAGSNSYTDLYSFDIANNGLGHLMIKKRSFMSLFTE